MSDRRYWKKKADKLCRLLCALCQMLEKNGRWVLLNDAKYAGELEKWWKEHKKIDAARLKREAEEKRRRAEKQAAKERRMKLKNQALGKLTKDERKALGIK